MQRHLAAGLLLAAVAIAACSDDGDDAAAPTSTSTATSTTVADEAGLETDLADGRHPVLLTGLDLRGRTLTVDVIQFLTGDEAAAAYQRDNPGETGGPPNDYYIVNDNPRERTLAVADPVDVQLVRLEQDGDAGLSPGTFGELPDYFGGYASDDGTLWYNPFWLTIEGGAVVGIEEQYLP